MICSRLADDAAAADAWRNSLDLLRALPVKDVADKLVPRMSALADAERRLGRYEQSERGMREAIAISEAHLPRDQRHARLLNNLGALEWDEQRFDEASQLLREALRVTEEDPKSTPLRIAVAHHNLANLKREQGEWEEAEELHHQALGIAREHLTKDPQFPIFLKELAVLYADEERYDEAFALWDEALSALGEKRGELLASEILYERGRADLARGHLDAAEKSRAVSAFVKRSAPPIAR
jgi:tetratricopeptide (TPR) repeat protein